MRNGIIFIGNNIFETLLAISEEEQARGLMYVEPPAPIMSFAYSQPKINKFWMHNTKIPLDIVFCHNRKVSQICYGEPYSTKVIGDDKLSDLVIELPHGMAMCANIKFNQDAGLMEPKPSELHKIFANQHSTIFKI